MKAWIFLMLALGALAAPQAAWPASAGQDLLAQVRHTLELWEAFFGEGSRTKSAAPGGTRRAEPRESLRFYPVGRTRGFYINDPRPFFPLFAEAAERTGVPEAVLAAVAACESSFVPDAVSPKGARGLMQIMPVNFEPLGVRDPFDPRESVMGGARFLRTLYLETGSWEGALSSYHCGLGCWRRGRVPGVTRRYVDCVLGQHRFFRAHGPWG